MTSLKAAALSIIALGTIGPGSIFLHKHLTKTTVEKKLQENKNRVILNKESGKEEWESIVSPDKGNTEDLSTFIKLHTSIEGEISTERLMNACEKVMKKEATEENLNKARLYCTKETQS